MVVWSFGVDCSRLEAWNLAGRDDAMAALAAKVVALFSDMVCGVCDWCEERKVFRNEQLKVASSPKCRSCSPQTEVHFNIAIIKPNIPISLSHESQSQGTHSCQYHGFKNIIIISLSIARLGLYLYF